MRWVAAGLAIMVALSACTGDESGADASQAQGGRPTAPQTADAMKAFGSPDDVVAVVNGEEITAGAVDDILRRRVDVYMRYTGQQLGPEEIARQRRQLIEQMVSEEVMRQAIANAEMVISDADVAARLDDIAGQFPSMAVFTQYLARNEYTLEGFRDDLRSDMKAQRLMEQSMGVTTATVDEAESFYNENMSEFAIPPTVEFQQVLFGVPPEAPRATQEVVTAELTEVREKILGGMPFEAAMAEYSMVTGTWVLGEGQEGVSELLQDAAFGAELSNVTDVVDTEYGSHLLYVLGRSDARTASFDEVKETLMNVLSERKYQDAAEEWKNKLRSKADVEIK